jgi:hypothetical protein
MRATIKNSLYLTVCKRKNPLPNQQINVNFLKKDKESKAYKVND